MQGDNKIPLCIWKSTNGGFLIHDFDEDDCVLSSAVTDDGDFQYHAWKPVGSPNMEISFEREDLVELRDFLTLFLDGIA